MLTRLIPRYGSNSVSARTSLNRFTHSRSIIQVSEEVRHALETKQPIVALESTIISHGLPFPHNLDVARSLEAIVRENGCGCVPATMAIINGNIKVGLTPQDLQLLASPDAKVIKTSRRDFAHVVAGKLHGATTVASTMWIANQIGVHVFATGGIGGVHRGVSETMDVSADLTELGRTPVAVVCSGVKKTMGVTVATLNSNQFPAFYTRDSGIESPLTLPTEFEMAQLVKANLDLDLQSGLVIAVPIPEDKAPDAKLLQSVIEEAIQAAVSQGIHGKHVTPFILKRVAEKSKGLSLKANIALVENNARVGSRIAKHLADLYNPSSQSSRNYSTARSQSAENSRPIVIIGGTALDFTGKIDADTNPLYTSNPGIATQTLGGVGRNVAEACLRSGGNPVFVSAVGDDMVGRHCLDKLNSIGMDTTEIITSATESTAVYNAILDSKGDLVTAVADMRINKALNSVNVESLLIKFRPQLLAFDGNLDSSAMRRVLTDFKDCKSVNPRAMLCFEPTSVEKSKRLLNAMKDCSIRHIDIMVPNLMELEEMHQAGVELGLIYSAGQFKGPSKMNMWDRDIKLLQVLQLTTHLVVKNGIHGVKYFCDLGNNEVEARHFDAQAVSNMVSATGAGDTLLGVMLHVLTQTNMDFTRAIPEGMKAASLSVSSRGAVSENIKPFKL
ncbi:pseudouridylate synthase [Synchytrium microbalum]|uniref:Pseudouridylate synthase n=1 Tax=Synchytrium microbalum TaxID=1806994 RepID=A0A507C6K3_9FUNG|nr:pseudouridylate synthase [Synchytrium microbalum]TPX35252.1 pseudouridylate synthase [Synchytrium microbalum]